MATLRFRAREDHLVREPNSWHVAGAKACYIGRKWDQKLHGFPAVDDHHTVESETSDGQRLMLLCSRDGCLWPADRETAAACGVPYEPHKFANGAWVADPDASKE